MAGGSWNATETKIRPGLYINFVALALAQIKGGERGIVALPIVANYGADKTIVVMESEQDCIEQFGESLFSVVRCFKGGAKTILAYRVNSGGTKATLTLGGLTVTAKENGTIGNQFTMAVKVNILESTKRDVEIYRNGKIYATYAGVTTVEDAVTAINADKTNLFMVASGTGVLSAGVATPLSGGTNGTALNEDYMDFLDVIEAQRFTVFAMPNVTDPALQASFQDFCIRLRNEGVKVMLVLGGSKVQDATPTIGNTRSLGANHEGIINLVTGAIVFGVEYSSSEMTSQVAGMVAGTPITKSITYMQIRNVDDVNIRLTNYQVKQALSKGSLCFVHDGEIVKVEQGINTLSIYGSDQNERFSKIRVIATLDQINNDVTVTGNKFYIGKVDNDEDGQKALMSAVKAYFEVLASAKAIKRDFTIELDDRFVSQGDTVYFKIGVTPIDSMEKIYFTVFVG